MIKIPDTMKTLGPQQAEGPTQAEQKLLDAAKMYEKQFLREMVKAMRTTVPGDGLVQKGQAEKIFQEQLDHEYVENWGDQGGMGLHKVIYDQLIDRYGTQLGIKPRTFPQRGPIAIEPGNTYSVNSAPTRQKVKPDNR